MNGTFIVIFYVVYAVNAVLMVRMLADAFAKREPVLFFWAAYLGNYHVPALFDALTHTVKPHASVGFLTITPENLAGIQLYILAMNAAIYLSERLLFRERRGTIGAGPSQNRGLRSNGELYVVRAFIAVFFVSMLYFISVFGLNQTFDDARSNASVASLIFLRYNSILVIGAVSYFAFERRLLGQATAIIALAALLFTMGGSRQPLLVALAVIGVIYLLLFFKSSTPLLVFVFGAPWLLWFAQMLLYLRNLSGAGERIAFIVSGEWWKVAEYSSLESNLRFAFYYFYDNAAILSNYLFQWSYIERTLQWWAPAFLFGDFKRSDFEYVLYSLYMNNDGGSLHPTFYGMTYADTGYHIWIWLLMFIVVRFIDRSITRQSVYLSSFSWGVMAYVWVMWARGSLYAPVIVLIYLIALLGAIWLLRKIALLPQRGNVRPPRQVRNGVPRSIAVQHSDGL